ncbi:hypothetical protein N7468_004286 [Penicillium chermesinum]|uniref:WLM domain-containing protein n=1 Tax=Penicillium chermesinum TaxID=63820 RepID=A0A9W9PB35_9EURO|nr:uncharacterized protein N7468_004286 [Penicillium chermesinum]KAJ5239667.1 hypothetical protein N7468_004286 [Penicillium chermesinum]
MQDPEAIIREYRHDKSRPRQAEALKILQQIASMVKPIMRQHSCSMRILPRNANLLGMNDSRGYIYLRLRYARDPEQFLPFEEIADTMLHELCHIPIKPHNKAFHNLWNQLRDEHVELAMKGFTGGNFLSEGRRLGGSRIPMDEARRQARAAAEREKWPDGKIRTTIGWSRSPEGRRFDEEVLNGCASGTHGGAALAEEASRNGFRTQAEEDDANEQAIMQAFIELIQEEEREKYGSAYVPPSEQNPAGPHQNITSESPSEGSSSKSSGRKTSSSKAPGTFQKPE